MLSHIKMMDFIDYSGLNGFVQLTLSAAKQQIGGQTDYIGRKINPISICLDQLHYFLALLINKFIQNTAVITINYFSTIKNTYFLWSTLINLRSHQNKDFIFGDDDEKSSSCFPSYGFCFNGL